MKESAPRFQALDVLRGLTVCFMIIVNSPGSWDNSWAALKHAQWHGFTPTDLVFPTFMFVVGNAMAFVFPKWEGLSNRAVLGKIAKRTLLIFLLGYLMYWFPFVHWNEQGQLLANPIAETRIMGVLQRIALGYFLGALLVRYLRPVQLLWVAALLLLGYWGVLHAFGDPADPYNMLTNAGTQLDNWLFGEKHLYHGEGVAFDPEGMLGTLPATVNVLIGYLAGKWIREKGNSWEGIAKLLLAGSALVALSLLWNISFPINKKLWTGSFVLLTTGIDCVILGALIYWIDQLGYKGLNRFFEVPGKNPLFVYLLSELGLTLLWFFKIGENNQPVYAWLYNHIYVHAGLNLGSFLLAFSWMMTCWLAGYILDKNKIYVRV